MIVKNESAVIVSCLDAVLPLISCYLINDTGSTDNTPEIITKYFEEKNIPGRVVIHNCQTCDFDCHGPEYKYFDPIYFHFGWNRSCALEYCYDMDAEYILVVDADDIFTGKIDLSNLTENYYYLNLKLGTSTYQRIQLVKNKREFKWAYGGGLHEALISHAGAIGTKHMISGDYYFNATSAGFRSQDPKKYLKDCEFMVLLCQQEPTNTRLAYYCAQSHESAGLNEKAVELFQKRIEMGGWTEEVYIAKLKLAKLYKLLNYPHQKIVDAFLSAWSYLVDRMEALYYLVKYLYDMGKYNEAYFIGLPGIHIKPSNHLLFVETNLYDYEFLILFLKVCYKTANHKKGYKVGQRLITEAKHPNLNFYDFLDNYSLCSYYSGHYLDAYKSCEKLVTKELYSPEQKQRLLTNLDYFREKV